MATSATSAGKVNLQKRLYDEDPSDPMFEESKFMNMITHNTSFYGEGKYLVVKVSDPAGFGFDFSTALAAQAPSEEVRFFVTKVEMFGIYSIQNSAIFDMENNKGAIVELIADEQKRANREWGRRMSFALLSQPGGTLGTLSNTTTSTLTIKLDRRTSLRHIRPKMQLEFANDTGLTSPGGLLPSSASPTYATVTDINRQTNAVTVTLSTGGATLSTITGLTTATYVFPRGSYTQANSGLLSWVPTADPSVDESFFTVDRTEKDIQMLSGIRPSMTGLGTMRECINRACTEAFLQSAGDDAVIITNPTDMEHLANEIDIQTFYTNRTGPTGISFQVGKLMTPNGTMSVLSEPDYPSGTFHMGHAKNYSLNTAGGCPRSLLANGKWLDSSTQNARQGRIGMRGQTWVKDPGHWTVGTWPHTAA